jgi:hypothetical protein
MLPFLVRSMYLWKDTDFHIIKAAEIVRSDILLINNCFNGSFNKTWQSDCTPNSLLTLLKSIMRGQRLEQVSEKKTSSLNSSSNRRL